MPKDFTGATRPLTDAAQAIHHDRPKAATEGHVRSLHTHLKAIERGDFGSLLAGARPDVALDIFAPPDFPWIRRARGVAELRRAVERNFGSVEDQKPVISSVVAEGDTVILIGRETGRIREGAIPYEVEFVERFTFQEGQLASIRIIAAYATA